MLMDVCTVVVTYNRSALPSHCLAALRTQTHPIDRIIVVDNASTDDTPDVLRDCEHVRLDANAGSAGGFAAGLEAAWRTGCGWIWLMDDDVQPAADALELLLRSE